jgi:hypothetical protein
VLLRRWNKMRAPCECALIPVTEQPTTTTTTD